MYKVVITGFPTLEEAKMFCSWYEGQGEQDAPYWFEENNPHKSTRPGHENDGRTPMTDGPIRTTHEGCELTVKMV